MELFGCAALPAWLVRSAAQCSLTLSLPSPWETSFHQRNECANFIQYQPTVECRFISQWRVCLSIGWTHSDSGIRIYWKLDKSFIWMPCKYHNKHKTIIFKCQTNTNTNGNATTKPNKYKNNANIKSLTSVELVTILNVSTGAGIYCEQDNYLQIWKNVNSMKICWSIELYFFQINTNKFHWSW